MFICLDSCLSDRQLSRLTDCVFLPRQTICYLSGCQSGHVFFCTSGRVCQHASLDTCLSVWTHAVSVSHHVFPSLPVIHNVLNKNDKMTSSSSPSASIRVSILAVTKSWCMKAKFLLGEKPVFCILHVFFFQRNILTENQSEIKNIYIHTHVLYIYICIYV